MGWRGERSGERERGRTVTDLNHICSRLLQAALICLGEPKTFDYKVDHFTSDTPICVKQLWWHVVNDADLRCVPGCMHN